MYDVCNVLGIMLNSSVLVSRINVFINCMVLYEFISKGSLNYVCV